MPLEQLTLSDEQVQDIVASLITSGNNTDAVYDDVNDTLTVSLSNSISVGDLEATGSVTANGTEYAGTFATEGDLPDPSNFPVGAEATVESDPNNETSVYKLVDE